MRRNLHYIYQQEAGEGGAPAGGGTGSTSQETDWRANLSEEFRSDPALQDFKDVNGLAKAFADTKRMVGSMIRIPGEDAGEQDIQNFRQKLLENQTIGLLPKPDPSNQEEMDAFFKAIGAPDSPDQYQVPEEYEPERAGLLAKLAHQAGVTQKQFETVVKGITEADNAAIEDMERERQEGLTQLKGEWGDSFNSRNDRAAALAKNTGGPQELVEAIQAGKVNAETLKWLDKIALSIGNEGAELAKQIGGDVQGQTRMELMEQRDELTRKMQSERMPHAEYQRNLTKLVSLNEKLASLRV